MAPAVDSPSSTFARSHSESDLQAMHSGFASDRQDAARQDFDLPSFNEDFDLNISLLSKRPVVAEPVPVVVEKPEDAEPEPEPQPQPLEPLAKTPSRISLARSRTGSFIDRPRSWFPGTKSSRDTLRQDEAQQRPASSYGESDRRGPSPKPPVPKSTGRTLTVSDSLVNLAKRSWIPSRSPSPRGRLEATSEERSAAEPAPSLSRRLSRTRKGPNPADERPVSRKTSEAFRQAPNAFTRATSYFTKPKQPAPSSVPKLDESSHESDHSYASSAASLAPPATESIESATSQSNSCESNAATTDDSSSEIPNPYHDTLWSSFKNLDIEYRSFLGKQTPQRIQQVKSILLPFLRETMDHESVKVLSPEDVDRRAVILNKWWNAVLELLEDQGLSYATEVDRPVLLEVAAAIMIRTEWRQTTPLFLPLADRASCTTPRPRLGTVSSQSSISSNGADFLAESAEHSVRTMFVTTMMRQLAFAVDKMTLRIVPINLVTFAGKTFAYGFFFAPGVADVLVRLWGLTPELIRRASDELGLPRKNSSSGEQKAASFPPAIGCVKWSSPRSMWETLKIVPPMSMMVARIPWMGPWISRWKGLDTDLFFNFCKNFHILLDQFVPFDESLKEKAACPGFVLVHAQLLSTVEMTIHRQNLLDGGMGLDALQGADASASALLPPPSMTPWKTKPENKLVAMLKDFLFDDSSDIAGAKHTFAESCLSMVSAATRKISQFNSTASFALCDFLEEALPIYADFEASAGSKTYINWTFWVDVWSKILRSINTMAEIRVLAFIFTIWETITADPNRKKAICVDWLLSEPIFDAYFNHWCPMVRAYYHRLLCWRICRDEGRMSEVDAHIFSVVATRLRTVWAHYLYLRDDAEKAGRLPPSSMPMLPTPNKKFVIIRQELNIPQPGLLADLDTLARPSSSGKDLGNTSSEGQGPAKNDVKKRWSLLGKVLSLGSNNDDADPPAPGLARRPSWEDDFLNVRRETAESRQRQVAPPPPPKTSDTFASSPIYEEPQFVFRFILAWQQQTMPNRNRVLVRPVLPGPAQARVRLRTRSESAPPPSPSLPLPTRNISGSSEWGLIESARNAASLTTSASSPNLSRQASSVLREAVRDPVNEEAIEEEDDEGPQASQEDALATPERIVDVTKPMKPVGIHVQNAVYTGRALAEWAGVVFEYNNFIERRRDEGVCGLSEVEVPLLGAEGFRKLAG